MKRRLTPLQQRSARRLAAQGQALQVRDPGQAQLITDVRQAADVRLTRGEFGLAVPDPLRSADPLPRLPALEEAPALREALARLTPLLPRLPDLPNPLTALRPSTLDGAPAAPARQAALPAAISDPPL